jgi:hypothetical protein
MKAINPSDPPELLAPSHKPALTGERKRLRQPQLSRLLNRLMQDSPDEKSTAHMRALVGAVLEDAVRENASDKPSSLPNEFASVI